MDYQTTYINPDIKLSCFDGRLFKTEALFEDHMLVWFISGETKIIQADKTYVFGAGDTFLIPRNLLGTIINYPKDGLPHKAVAMHLSASRLKAFYAKNKAVGNPARPQAHGYTGERASPREYTIRVFSRHPLLESCLASLIPYFKLQETLPENIASLKIEEAVNILRTIDKDIDSLLAEFGDPGKIHLTDFMEKNYMFNMTMEKFGYLTGRSLTTFKRDFKKTFHTTPQKWLTQKRLELAHYRIREQRGKPSDVYIEVGFENLSHFTYAFKKHFGYAPTAMRLILLLFTSFSMFICRAQLDLVNRTVTRTDSNFVFAQTRNLFAVTGTKNVNWQLRARHAQVSHAQIKRTDSAWLFFIESSRMGPDTFFLTLNGSIVLTKIFNTIPEPPMTAHWGALRKDTATTTELIANRRMMISIPGRNGCSCQIFYFDIGFITDQLPAHKKKVSVEGSLLTADAAGLISKLIRSDKVVFSAIRVEGNDSRTRELPGFTIVIK